MTGQTTLTIKVFLEDSFTPLNNVRIRLTPLDTKDSKKPKDETQESISQNGVLRFNLPSNANTFELTILDTRFLEKAKGDNIKTTNNYSNTPNPTITLNLIGKPSLCFNGYELQIHQNNKIIQSFKAYSGNALSEQEKVDLQKNKSYKKFVAHEYTDSAQNIIQYFCLDKDYQKQKDKGAIPEGIYYINISQSKENKQSGIREYNNAWYSFSRSKEGEKQWGKYNIPIYTNKDCNNTTESSTKRQGFYIHGGESYGDNGGIDLAKEINGFIASIQRFSNQALMSNAIESNNTIPITLLVEYTHILSNTDLQSIYLHREIQRADNNTHTTEKHRVVLTANYIKPDSMSVESFNAQKQQTYWAYKELSQTEEYNTDSILLSELQFFKRNNKKYRGEQIEINLIEHQWHNYDKQIMVFAFSPKDILQNESGEEVLKKPKWRIVAWHNPIVNPQITIYTQSQINNPQNATFMYIRFYRYNTSTQQREPRPHQGIDLFANIGTPVYACLDGKVIKKRFAAGYGNGILIAITGLDLEIMKHKLRNSTYSPYYIKGNLRESDRESNFNENSEVFYLYYAHLSTASMLEDGEEVVAGQIIGYSGVSVVGSTYGPHLHFEISSSQNNGIPRYRINPAYFFHYKNHNELTNEEKNVQYNASRILHRE